MSVACSGGDGPLVRQAAGCRAALTQTLSAASLNSTSTGHGALKHDTTGREEEKKTRLCNARKVLTDGTEMQNDQEMKLKDLS